MRRAIKLSFFIWLWSSQQALAATTLNWFEHILYLRFGAEQLVQADENGLDLRAMASDEYWYVDGKVWFFPGEFLPLSDFQRSGSWDNLLRDKKPLLVSINNSYYQNSKNPGSTNYGTYVIRMRNDRKLKLSFGPYNVYHPASFYFVQANRNGEIRSFGQPDPDPNKNRYIYTLCCATNVFDVEGDFFLVSHASTPVSAAIKTPNFSGFFLGPENYLNQQMRITFCLLGAMIGCFFLAGVFYGFIFTFRRRDRSSLYLSLFALLAFGAGSLGFFETSIDSHYINRTFTLLNLLGIACLQLFIVEKVRAFLGPKIRKIVRSGILLGCASGIFSVVVSWGLLSTVIYLLLMASSLVLMGLIVVLGIRHRIHGTGFFILGSLVCMAFQYSMIRIGLFDLNADAGNAISLANLAMTLALALVNAKEFAVTYRSIEVLSIELQQALLQVQEKEKARTLFFQNTSHELRTPLNGIIGFMQLLTQGRYGSLPGAADVQLQKCIRLAISLKNQVNTILDLAKSKKGNLSLNNSAIDLKELKNEVDDLAAGLLLRRADLSFTLHADWAADRATFIGDREKLGAILRNLLGNAFKFSDPIRPNAVTLTLKREDGRLRIIVYDTGIGIPLEHQEKIFEEFQQIAGDARRAYEGTGLGLAMVRDFVKLMGGEIRVESEPGHGSRFMVDIPEQKEVHLQQAVEPSVNRSEGLRPTLAFGEAKSKSLPQAGQGRLLVVDDNEMNCEVLRELLEQEGFTVRTVLDGQEALRIMREEHPDLLLLDMMMPYFSGEDVIKAMQGDTLLTDIPVILITARASDDDRLFGLSLGADDYLAKPIHHEELLFRVKNILHRLQTKQKLVAAEEGQKMAQLGRLMQEHSHELKNVFHLDNSRVADLPQACECIVLRLPLKAADWPLAARQTSSERYISAEHVQIEALSFTEPKQKQSPHLRSLRATLAFLDIEPEARLRIWHEVLAEPDALAEEIEQTLYVVKNFLQLQHQSAYASELVTNILDYARRDDNEEQTSTLSVIDNVSRLIKPRLYRLGIQLTVPEQDQWVRIHKGQLMQVMLNLLSNACDAVEGLAPEQKWIRISIEFTADQVVLRCANGGSAFSPAQAEAMLQDAWTSKGQKGYGLGLSICLRLIQKAQGALVINTSAPYPEITLTLRPGEARSKRQVA